MRIISGTARGRQLANFSSLGIRPTPDRVREALFSILNSRFESFSGLKVLELFGGTGALSLEALSRGAASALVVDSSMQAVKLIRENAIRCKLEENIQVLHHDVFTALPTLTSFAPFDLILLDPPYMHELVPKVLNMIEPLQLLSEDGIICAESASNEIILGCGRLELFESRKYGSTTIHLLAFKED